jgi:long-chain acyl-CoA synthetase
LNILTFTAIQNIKNNKEMKKKLRGFKRSAIELDFNLYRREVPVADIPGDRLSVIDIQPEGVKRTIMLVHGYAGCAETWEHQINSLSKRFHVVAPDLRGHGQSDAPYSRYTMDELVADLFNITQTITFPDKFVLVGHSFGGSICVEYANRHPEQLERLILVATAGEYPLPKMATLLYRLPAAFYRPWWKYRPRWNAEIHSLKRMMINNVRLWHGWTLLRNIETPTMVITGERDNYFPRYVFDDVGVMVPKAEVIDIGGSKHKVQLERHEAVNRAIERFIDGEKKVGDWRSQDEVTNLKRSRPWLDAYSKGTPHTVPIPRRPLHDFLYSAADWLPNRKATIFYGSVLTYGKLAAKVNQLSHALHGFGVGPGERVMIVLPNMPDFIISYYATLVLGGVAVLSNPDANLEQLIQQARQTKVRVLITTDDLARLAQSIIAKSEIKELVLVEIDEKVPAQIREQMKSRWRADYQAPEQIPIDESTSVPMSEIMASAPTTRLDVQVEHDAMAAVLYTSGTTSDPKGVCLSHANLVANAIQTRHWVPDLEYGLLLWERP